MDAPSLEEFKARLALAKLIQRMSTLPMAGGLELHDL